MIWSGLSWAAGEVRAADLSTSRPVQIKVGSREKPPIRITIEAYAVLLSSAELKFGPTEARRST